MNISFTGHRDYNPELLDQPLYKTITELCSHFTEGVTFWCGMAAGFDIAAGEAVIEAQRRGANARLVCVVPFAHHAARFSPDIQSRYQALLDEAKEVITLAESYNKLVFLRRNDYLLANCKMLIAYHNGTKKGGTAYTIRNATKLKIATINLYPQPQLSLWTERLSAIRF
ncbi:MAG: SLOG family protein [Rikenellaceae bacterium]